MDHRLLQSVGFWAFLFSIDKHLAATACRAGGIPVVLDGKGFHNVTLN